jgi:hypothetical protein
MRQIRLKSVVQKLCLVSVYLLFLTVQLNLKYTFSDIVFSDYSTSLLNNGKSGIKISSVDKSQDSKPVVQKLRLNKRYVHQDVFLIFSFNNELVNNFYINVGKAIIPTLKVSNVSISHALLRGPPQFIASSC